MKNTFFRITYKEPLSEYIFPYLTFFLSNLLVIPRHTQSYRAITGDKGRISDSDKWYRLLVLSSAGAITSR